MATRPKLLKTDPEMQRWCALILEEVSGWPDVTSRPMFGMVAVYRGRRIFAAIPRTRAARTPFSLLIKLPGVSHPQLTTASGPGAGWTTFEMDAATNTTDAMRWLERAYRETQLRRRSPR